MPSLIKAVKKTIRARGRSSESNNSKPTSKGKKPPSDRAENGSKNTKTKGAAPTNRKRATRSVTKSVSKESNASSSVSREVDQRSRMSRIEPTQKSIDLEEDPEPIVPTPELNLNTRRDEVKEMIRDDKKEEEAKEKKPKVKAWSGSDAGVKFWESNNKIAKLRAEYTFLESLQVNKTTDAFDANTERNRIRAPKIYDENRVVLNRPGHEGNNYINASFISVKDFAHKLIIAQLPRMENESFIEDFWHMIYQEQITLVYLLMPSETLKAAATKLFKEESGEYQYVGKMFINNRRADARGAADPKEYTIEVLPEGNSDSVMCQVLHHATWQHLQQPPKTHRIIKMIHQFLTEKEVQAAGVCVVSEFGSGRACTFIAALIAINMLNKGLEPNICEIMTNIKQQRPGATESFTQYAGIYAVVLDYIARKRTSSKFDSINKEINQFLDQLAELTPPTSTK